MVSSTDVALTIRKLPPVESLTGSQIHEAAQEYSIEFVGQLPDEN